MLGSDIFDFAIIAGAASFAVSVLIVITQNWHGRHSLDNELNGVQKFHKTPVPRVGGIALLIGILTTLASEASDNPDIAHHADTGSLLLLLLAAMPAFLAGLLEDLTKRVTVRTRLLASLASAFLACWLLGAYLPRLDIWGIDELLRMMPLAAIAMTTFAVAGVTNSVNIIDGFHGVAGSVVAIMLIGMAFLAWQANDAFAMQLALLGMGATLGFLFVNYPTGRLFMGDGGAYFLGFWVAEVAVLLVIRNPQINAWQILAICAYPVIEVMYSIYRRKVIRKVSPGTPDRLHLHTLIYRRIVCQWIPRNDERPWIRNAAVACIVTTWAAAMMLTAVLAANTVAAAIVLIMIDLLCYMAVYTRLIRGHWCLQPGVILGLRTEARRGSA